MGTWRSEAVPHPWGHIGFLIKKGGFRVNAKVGYNALKLVLYMCPIHVWPDIDTKTAVSLTCLIVTCIGLRTEGKPEKSRLTDREEMRAEDYEEESVSD